LNHQLLSCSHRAKSCVRKS